MEKVLRYGLYLLVVALLGACAAFERTDIPGTQIAENVAFSTEMAALSQTAVNEQAAHITEVGALITEAAVVNGVNNQLLGTLQAVVTPTVVLVQENAVELSSIPSGAQGSRLYIGTGVSDSLDDNGCVLSPRAAFDPGVQRIYATMIAYNLTAGTTMGIEWYRGDELVFSDSLGITQDNPQQCIWFDLDPSRVPLLPGEWRALGYADNFPAINAMVFTINGE